MNILLAIDESAYSRAALEGVLTRPWPDGSKFRVISSIEPFHPEYAGWQTSYVPLALEAQKEIRDAAEALVAEASKELALKFGQENVTGEAVEGYVKDKILETANDWPADLIVLGSHGRKGFTRFLLGSVSEAVVAHATCSVEIIKMPHPEGSGMQKR